MKKMAVLIFALSCLKTTAQLSLSSLGIKLKQSLSANPVQDQSMSSTCWSFASNSFLESEILHTNGQSVKLSEMFIARYSYINKIYKYLSRNGNIFFTPGGQFHDVIRVIKEYGMMPEESYNGLDHTTNGYRYDHELLDTAMMKFAKQLLEEGKSKPSENDLKNIFALLDKYIGKVPASFTYKGKAFTPRTFAKDLLHFNPTDYVEITSYTHHPFYSPFILEDKYNWTQDKYYNVSLNDFETITTNALQNGYTVEWDGDVDEPFFKYEEGLAYLPAPVQNPVWERQSTFEDKSTSLDHMMHIIGIASDKFNCKWYYVKNSWGVTNKLGGYLYMSDDYFKIKSVAIIVNKNAIPINIRRKLKL